MRELIKLMNLFVPLEIDFFKPLYKKWELQIFNFFPMNTVILVFAKPPLLNKVKSRLGKQVGKEASLWIYKKLLHQTAKVSFKSKLKTVLFEKKVSAELKTIFKHVIEFQIQKGKNLGSKMENAFTWAFGQNYKKIILIGSDLWSLDEETLIEAKEALEYNDLVIGPCYDGGYYLIGMKKLNKKLFNGISWGKKKVFKQTLSKISENSVYYLDIKNDIDDEQSLKSHKSLYDLYKKAFFKKY